MARSARALIVTLGAVVGCADDKPVAVDINRTYSDFLGAWVTRHSLEASFDIFVICARTSTCGRHRREEDVVRWPDFRQMFPSLRRDTYESFWAENAVPKAVTLEEAGTKRVQLIGSDELRRIFKGDGTLWQRQTRFGAAYPRARLIGLSALGFSRDGRQALVYVDNYGAGNGIYYLLGRGESGCNIVDEYLAWVE